MSNYDKNYDHQQSLDSLLTESQLHLGNFGDSERQFQDLLEQMRSQPETHQHQHLGQINAYSRDTPAQQHEKLSYMKNKTPYVDGGNGEAQRELLETPTSFLDDQFESSSFNDSRYNSLNNSSNFSARNSISNPHFLGTERINSSYREPPIDHSEGKPVHENQNMLGPDFLFQQGDDAMFSFADELSSSVGSSMNSEALSSSYSSSFSFQPQSLNGPSNSVKSATVNLSSHLSPIVKSPASSVRAGGYLSTSLRNVNSATPNTPKTRHASISTNMNSDMLYSSSVPRNLTHLSAEERLKRKREFHNAVERRRRELIKQKIKELGNIVPPSLLNYNGNGKQVKPNKGIILNRTVEYLEYLLQVLEAQDRKKTQLLGKIQELENKKRLQQNNDTYKERKNDVPTTISHEKDSDLYQPMDNEYEGIDTDVSKEKIIDGRAKPQPFSDAPHWNSGINIYNNVPTNNSLRGDSNSSAGYDRSPTVHDDLEQFLSGDLIEAEDNAKLLFNSGQPSADYLLEFDA